jgi:hypothetical protein
MRRSQQPHYLLVALAFSHVAAFHVGGAGVPGAFFDARTMI